MIETLIPLIPALPLAGFAFTALFGRRLGKRASLVPVLLVVVASWAIAMYIVLPRRWPAGRRSATASVGVHLWDWIPAGAFNVEFGFYVDNLTACLLIVVTTIGMLVHIYSIGYMAHDPGYWRFFAYLNLFMFSMLLLVLADNFLLVFAGWELVGLSSYLLIGFWYQAPVGRPGREEGVHRQPRRRRRLRARDHGHLREPGHAQHPGRRSNGSARSTTR